MSLSLAFVPACLAISKFQALQSVIFIHIDLVIFHCKSSTLTNKVVSNRFQMKNKECKTTFTIIDRINCIVSLKTYLPSCIPASLAVFLAVHLPVDVSIYWVWLGCRNKGKKKQSVISTTKTKKNLILWYHSNMWCFKNSEFFKARKNLTFEHPLDRFPGWFLGETLACEI